MNSAIRQIVSFLLFLFAQVLIFNHLELFQVAVPFVFLVYLLMLPLNTSLTAVYLLAFGMGILIDVLSEHTATGLHAFSCVLMMSVRRWWAGVVGSTSTRGLDDIVIGQQSAIFFALYLLPLILLHQVAYFMLEDFTFQRFFYNFWKAILGTVYTFAMAYIITYLFYKR